MQAAPLTGCPVKDRAHLRAAWNTATRAYLAAECPWQSESDLLSAADETSERAARVWRELSGLWSPYQVARGH